MPILQASLLPSRTAEDPRQECQQQTAKSHATGHQLQSLQHFESGVVQKVHVC